MQSRVIFFSVFVTSALFLAIGAQGTGSPHQRNHDSHGSAPDPHRPYMTLWRKRGNNAVNYQYNLHKPVQNGQVNQHGSVTLFKPPHKKNQPDQSGFLISYSISQDFDSSKPQNQYNQNNMGDNSNSLSHGSTHAQPSAHHQSTPLHHTRPHHLYRNDDQASDRQCYNTVNSNQVLCCVPSYNGGYQRCWRQNIMWE